MKRVPHRITAAFAFGQILGLSTPAVADDPCSQPATMVSRLVSDINRSVAVSQGGGTFRVKKTSREDEPSAYIAEYVIDGRSVFTGRFVQRPAISDHLAVEVSPKARGTLVIAYGFGARGAISCDFAVSWAGNSFRSRRLVGQ